MGLFNFIKNAGAKVFGKGKETKRETATVEGGQDEKEKQENYEAARKLERTIHDLDLKIQDLKIEIEDDMATIWGVAKTQSIREKIILVVGNVEGIAKVDDNMEVENKEPEAVFHTVETGDTLGKIAEEHYGSQAGYEKIFEANKPMLKEPDKIYPGQVLRIPPEKK